MFTPMARLLLVDLDGQDSVAPGGRLPSIPTCPGLLLPPRASIAARFGRGGALQHLGGTAQRALADGHAVEHCRQLLLPRGFVKSVDHRDHATIPLALDDLE